MLGHTPRLDEVIDVTRARGPVTRCRLRLFPGAGGPVVVVTELAENTGASVTNAAEDVWWAVARRFGITRFTLVEHYDQGSYAGGRDGEETFDRVTVAAGEPKWEHLGSEGLRRLLDVLTGAKAAG